MAASGSNLNLRLVSILVWSPEPNMRRDVRGLHEGDPRVRRKRGVFPSLLLDPSLPMLLVMTLVGNMSQGKPPNFLPVIFLLPLMSRVPSGNQSWKLAIVYQSFLQQQLLSTPLFLPSHLGIIVPELSLLHHL